MTQESIQALSALGKAVEVTSGNLANVNTPEYQARRLRLEDGPGGRGVRASHVDVDTTPGPPIAEQRPVDAGRAAAPRSGSNVDVARETVDLIRSQNAFAANAAMVRAWDETTGLLVNRTV